MSKLLLVAALLALAPKIADYCKWLREKYYRAGILFGLLCIAANLGNFRVSDVDVVVGIPDVPVILATFYFGAGAGLTAAVVSFLAHILLITTGVLSIPVGTALSTPAVALYAAAMEQWVFEERRPPVIPAAIVAFFGEIVHMAFIYIIGSYHGQEARMLDILSADYPIMPLAAALAAALSAILCGSRQGLKKNFFTSLIFSLLFLGGAFYLVESFSIQSAYRQTDSAILAGVSKLEVQVSDQIDYSMHGLAELLVKEIGKPDRYDRDKLQKYADLLDIDEINIFTKDGKILASNRQAVLDRSRENQNPEALKDFFALTDGTQNFVKQDFRQSRSEPDVIAKYIGVPFPDRSAFLQLGFALERLQEEFETYFFPMFNKTTIGETGFFVVTDTNGKIVAPVANHKDTDGEMIFDIGMTKEQWNTPLDEFCEVKFFGSFGRCYRSFELGEWRIYAFLPYTEFFCDALTQICVYTLILFLICIAFRLAMVRIAKAQKKIDDMRATDMELASSIQNSELPGGEFENSACRIRASMTPAKEVGGDFYDYYELPDGRIVVTIADVSGKGIPAAIFMMKAKNILREFLSNGTELAPGISRANFLLNKNNNAAMFVTAWTGIFSPADNTLTYVSAGHNPPLILRQDGSIEWLNQGKRQKPLAAFAKVAYQAETITFTAGDRLFLYTDGVTEAMNVRGELFGNERLEIALKEAPGDLIESVSKTLKKFTTAAPVADDITILTLENKQ